MNFTVVPQNYPLWLATLDDRKIRVGRVVAWRVAHGLVDDSEPIVAYVGQGKRLTSVEGALDVKRFLADTRNEAIIAARTARDGAS